MVRRLRPGTHLELEVEDRGRHDDSYRWPAQGSSIEGGRGREKATGKKAGERVSRAEASLAEAGGDGSSKVRDETWA